MKGAELIVKALEANHVKYVFGIPGNHILSVYDELNKSNIKTILPTQEQSAGFMADVYGRVTHKPGVVFVTAGPGVMNLVNAIAQAYVESSPVVVFGAQCLQSLWGKGCYHELKHPNVQLNIFKEITKWAVRVTNPNTLGKIVSAAFYKAGSGRFRPVFVEIPEDVFYGDAKETNVIVKEPIRKKPSNSDLRLFFEELKKSNRPVILAGGGIVLSEAQEELMAFSKLMGIPITTTIMGKSSCPADFDYNLGFGSGILASDNAKNAINNSDLIIAIGTRFDEVATGFFTLKLHERLIHIDIDKNEFNRNYPAILTIEADAKEFFRQAINLIQKNQYSQLIKRNTFSEANVQSNVDVESKMTDPNYFFRKLFEKLNNINSIFVGDAGYSSSWILGCRNDSKHLILTPSGYNSMGFSIPGAIGAKLGSPNSVVVAVCGDGSFLMTGLEFMTAVKYGVNIICVVLHDKRYNLLTLFQDLKYGGRYSDTIIETLDFSKLASDLGGFGIKIESNAQVESAIKSAFDFVGPSIIEVIVDPNLVPPLLQKIKPPKMDSGP